MSNTLFMHPALRLWLEMLSLGLDGSPPKSAGQASRPAAPESLSARVCVLKKVPRIDRLLTAGSFLGGAFSKATMGRMMMMEYLCSIG